MWGHDPAGVTDRYRLRVELPDRPGALAALATTIAEVGGNVVSVDIHSLDSEHAVDDIVVVLPGTDPDALAERLTATGTVVQSWRPEVGLTDSVVRALGWARHVLQSGVGYSDLEVSRALTEVCSADAAWVATLVEAEATGLATSALAGGHPTIERFDVLPKAVGGDGESGGWLLVAPDDARNPSVVAFVARLRPHRFTTTESARASALLALHRELSPTRP